MDKIFVESKKSQNCKRADMTLGIAFERGEILLPRKKKQGPMEDIGPCRCKGDHLRIIAKSQAYSGIIALFT